MVRDIAFSIEKNRFVSGGSDGRLILWHMYDDDMRILTTIKSIVQIKWINHLIYASTITAIRIYNTICGAVADIINGVNIGYFDVNGVILYADGSLLKLHRNDDDDILIHNHESHIRVCMLMQNP